MPMISFDDGTFACEHSITCAHDGCRARVHASVDLREVTAAFARQAWNLLRDSVLAYAAALGWNLAADYLCPTHAMRAALAELAADPTTASRLPPT